MPEIFDSIMSYNLTLETYLMCLAGALGCGILTAAAASVKSHVSRSFIATLVLLPMIVATVIMMVNGNIGTGMAVMGAFSLIRFRSVPGKAREIAVIFLSMTAGLACAAGYVGIALVFTALVSAVMLALAFLPLNRRTMDLHITVPESLRFAGAFDELFAQFTRSHRLIQAKTTNMGSLYKLHYRVEMKDAAKAQEFIDALRCRNGNLEIALCEMQEGNEEL